MKGRGPARWNSETQSWEDGTPPPAPYTGPMPPRPDFVPSAGAGPTGALPHGAGGPSADAPAGPPAGPSAGRVAGSGAGPVVDPLVVPTPVPPPAPGPMGGGQRRRTALIAGVAAAVIAAGVGGGYLLWGRGDDPAAARPPARTKASAPEDPATGTSAPPTDDTGPTASTDPTDPWGTAPPDGYRLVHDDKGFTTAVPDGWRRSVRDTGVFYTAPDDRGLVQIFEITEPDTAPEAALQKASEGLANNPGYEEISLGAFDGPAPGTDAAQLVYAYDSERIGERVKVVDCAFTADDGRQFAVLVLGTEADWPEQQRTQKIALQAFAATP
ncbi:hypothetical protein [Streptomyces sp. NPDC059008]|uniref:hypothetical protein n=1 Tax=Streptomyces sp. NPDC059008 TaxID=3346693 RepID=UPI0036BCD3CD